MKQVRGMLMNLLDRRLLEIPPHSTLGLSNAKYYHQFVVVNAEME